MHIPDLLNIKKSCILFFNKISFSLALFLSSILVVVNDLLVNP